MARCRVFAGQAAFRKVGGGGAINCLLVELFLSERAAKSREPLFQEDFNWIKDAKMCPMKTAREECNHDNFNWHPNDDIEHWKLKKNSFGTKTKTSETEPTTNHFFFFSLAQQIQGALNAAEEAYDKPTDWPRIRNSCVFIRRWKNERCFEFLLLISCYFMFWMPYLMMSVL